MQMHGNFGEFPLIVHCLGWQCNDRKKIEKRVQIGEVFVRDLAPNLPA